VSFSSGQGVFSVSRKLLGKDFHVALVLPNSPRSALEVWLARIPQRVGYARPWRNWLLTKPVHERPGAVAMRKRSVHEINELVSANGSRQASGIPLPPTAHHIHRYLHLAGALGAKSELLAPRLAVADDEIAESRKKFGITEKDIGGRPLLALNPGAEYGPAKRWPFERFTEAARRIHERTNCLWLILGGKVDAEIQRAADILSAEQNFRQDAGSTFLNLAGRTSLRELMALLKCCRLLLTNDTGPMHVAAAVGTPVVVPFGSTSPELTGPGLPGDLRHHLLKSDAPCSPCFRRECPIDFRCMKGISVERVVEAVLSVVAL
jgi:heptosyltransferase-2